MMKAVPGYATVFQSNDTIKFGVGLQNVTIVALMMGGDRAMNLTGTQHLPNYSADNVFVIYGLMNPTLVVPKGTNLQILVINLDESDYHNLDLTTTPPPYSYMPMMSSGGMMNNRGGISALSMMPMLAPANYDQETSYAYGYTLTVNNPGTLWYFCMYPGHAQTGMYGKILVVG